MVSPFLRYEKSPRCGRFPESICSHPESPGALFLKVAPGFIDDLRE